jgi:hypothetical protein
MTLRVCHEGATQKAFLLECFTVTEEGTENAHAPTPLARFIKHVAVGDGCPVSDVGHRDASPPHSDTPFLTRLAR